MDQVESLFRMAAVRVGLNQAWRDSQPGTSDAHEEGGYILHDSAAGVRIVRWPKGKQNAIIVTPHKLCRVDGDEILATFHTHPNIGLDYLQEPSETDRRAVRDDPDLKGARYIGEFVISKETIYIVDPVGIVSIVGAARDLI